MSVHVLSWVLKHSPTQGNDRLCLVVLANYADEEGFSWPGLPRIAWEMGRVSERTAQRALRSLEEGRFIITTLNGAPDSRIPGNRKPNAYRILRGDRVVTPETIGVTTQADRGDNPGSPGVTPGVTQDVMDPSVDPSRASLPDGSFDGFWSRYPARNGRKVGKKAAEDKWAALSIAHRAEVLLAVEIYAAAITRGESIAKDASRFLTRRYWQDWMLPNPLDRSIYGQDDELCLTCNNRRVVFPDGQNMASPCPTCRKQGEA